MLGVANMQIAAGFYRDRLGLRITRETDDVAFVDAGSIAVVLSTAVGKEPGSIEIVFTVDHVQAAYEALNEAGLVFEHKPHLVTGSSWAANFRDPDGHVLSLFGPK